MHVHSLLCVSRLSLQHCCNRSAQNGLVNTHTNMYNTTRIQRRLCASQNKERVQTRLADDMHLVSRACMFVHDEQVWSGVRHVDVNHLHALRHSYLPNTPWMQSILTQAPNGRHTSHGCLSEECAAMPYSAICKTDCPDDCWPEKYCDMFGCTCSAKAGVSVDTDQELQDYANAGNPQGDKSCECINATHPSYQKAVADNALQGYPENYGLYVSRSSVFSCDPLVLNMAGS